MNMGCNYIVPVLEVKLCALLPSALDGGEGWSDSHSGRFVPGERAPLYPLDRGLSEPQCWSGRGGERHFQC